MVRGEKLGELGDGEAAGREYIYEYRIRDKSSPTTWFDASGATVLLPMLLLLVFPVKAVICTQEQIPEVVEIHQRF
jgi:hypothetical protein